MKQLKDVDQAKDDAVQPKNCCAHNSLSANENGVQACDNGSNPRLDAVRQLKAARRESHVTQEELAERVGTKKSNISRFESGRYNPSLDFLIKVAEGLGRQLHIYIK